MAQAVVIKKQGLLENLAALTMSAQDRHMEVLKLHGGVLKTGCAMIRALQDYEKLGKLALGRAKPKAERLAKLRTLSSVVDQSSFRLGRAESLLADLTERDAGESQLQWTR